MNEQERIDNFFNTEWENPTSKFVGACLEYYKNYKFPVYQIHKLLPEVYVFKNLLPNIKNQIDLLKNSVSNESQSFFFNDWAQWGGHDGPMIFGQYLVQIGKDIEDYKNNNHNSQAILRLEQELIRDVIKGFYGATNYFIEQFNLSKDDWNVTSPSFCRYIPTTQKRGDGKFMAFHTDYQLDRAHEPGEKFVITSTFYLNDDYENGAIIFKTKDGEIKYKPEKGDILVFPSGHPSIITENLAPLLHAVEPIPSEGSDRWIVRMFYTIYSEGDRIPEEIKKLHEVQIC
jgi:hypothetical protein